MPIINALIAPPKSKKYRFALKLKYSTKKVKNQKKKNLKLLKREMRKECVWIENVICDGCNEDEMVLFGCDQLKVVLQADRSFDTSTHYDTNAYWLRLPNRVLCYEQWRNSKAHNKKLKFDENQKTRNDFLEKGSLSVSL